MISMVWTLTEMMVRLRGNLPNFRVFFSGENWKQPKISKMVYPKNIYLPINFFPHEISKFSDTNYKEKLNAQNRFTNTITLL